MSIDNSKIYKCLVLNGALKELILKIKDDLNDFRQKYSQPPKTLRENDTHYYPYFKNRINDALPPLNQDQEASHERVEYGREDFNNSFFFQTRSLIRRFIHVLAYQAACKKLEICQKKRSFVLDKLTKCDRGLSKERKELIDSVKDFDIKIEECLILRDSKPPYKLVHFLTEKVFHDQMNSDKFPNLKNQISSRLWIDCIRDQPAEFDLYDWATIAKVMDTNRFSEKNCQYVWSNFIKPGLAEINWDRDQLSKLESLVARFGANGRWVKIAKEMGPFFTPFMCLSIYQRELNVAHTKHRKWDEKELESLNKILNVLFSDVPPSIIDWDLVAQMHFTRTALECRLKAQKTMGFTWPSNRIESDVLHSLPNIQQSDSDSEEENDRNLGFITKRVKLLQQWTVEEDFNLLRRIDEFGLAGGLSYRKTWGSWHHITAGIPGRTIWQCVARYIVLCNHFQPFTVEEDLSLFRFLIKDRDTESFSKKMLHPVLPLFPGRLREVLYARYRVVRSWYLLWCKMQEYRLLGIMNSDVEENQSIIISKRILHFSQDLNAKEDHLWILRFQKEDPSPEASVSKRSKTELVYDNDDFEALIRLVHKELIHQSSQSLYDQDAIDYSDKLLPTETYKLHCLTRKHQIRHAVLDTVKIHLNKTTKLFTQNSIWAYNLLEDENRLIELLDRLLTTKMRNVFFRAGAKVSEMLQNMPILLNHMKEEALEFEENKQSVRDMKVEKHDLEVSDCEGEENLAWDDLKTDVSEWTAEKFADRVGPRRYMQLTRIYEALKSNFIFRRSIATFTHATSLKCNACTTLPIEDRKSLYKLNYFKTPLFLRASLDCGSSSEMIKTSINRTFDTNNCKYRLRYWDNHMLALQETLAKPLTKQRDSYLQQMKRLSSASPLIHSVIPPSLDTSIGLRSFQHKMPDWLNGLKWNHAVALTSFCRAAMILTDQQRKNVPKEQKILALFDQLGKPEATKTRILQFLSLENQMLLNSTLKMFALPMLLSIVPMTDVLNEAIHLFQKSLSLIPSPLISEYEEKLVSERAFRGYNIRFRILRTDTREKLEISRVLRFDKDYSKPKIVLKIPKKWVGKLAFQVSWTETGHERKRKVTFPIQMLGLYLKGYRDLEIVDSI
ncbi:Myblike DNAbinding domain-containing protein [Cichlidogyrus casuarinus]|uniref:Myblike DNAbinding domain-containing protein n=1 Tax=Cichlidogyrus casuarinus TaxID=1844966 RepID=A0ABD2QKE7_9PLAT